MTGNIIGWTHLAHEQMDCPDDGESDATHCRHAIDLDELRKRAEEYIESFGPGNWGRDEDVWIDMLRPTAGARDAVLMGRYIFAISPDAILALIDALEAQRRPSNHHGPTSTNPRCPVTPADRKEPT